MLLHQSTAVNSWIADCSGNGCCRCQPTTNMHHMRRMQKNEFHHKFPPYFDIFAVPIPPLSITYPWKNVVCCCGADYSEQKFVGRGFCNRHYWTFMTANHSAWNLVSAVDIRFTFSVWLPKPANQTELDETGGRTFDDAQKRAEQQLLCNSMEMVAVMVVLE